MTSINYITAIIKILESPKQKLLENNVSLIKFRGQLPLLRTTKVINVTFWGSLAQNISSYYKVGDYIMVEGYISLRNKENFNSSQLPIKKIELTVLKVYPLYSNMTESKNLIN